MSNSKEGSSKSNPLWFMGISNPRPIGYYSGNPRDFEKELISIEPDPDLGVEKYIPTQDDSLYDQQEFTEKAEKFWQSNTSGSTEEFWKQYPIWFIGQSHIDVAWKWRFGQTIKKTAITFGKAVKHIKHYPNYSFAGSQPSIFEMVLKTDPELFKEIQNAVKTDQFEITGGCWVEPDPRMPSGEAMVRQHLYGQRFFLRHFGKRAEIAWYQDSFGYSSQIPQYSVRSGMNYFFTNKIAYNKDTVFPLGHFHWFSPDGSHVLAYQTEGGFNPIKQWKKYRHTRRLLKPNQTVKLTYAINKIEDMAIWDTNLVPVIGDFYGKGDGGHGPTSEEFGFIRKWIELGKNVKPAKVIDFYRELEKYSDRIPIFQDELYYEYHRATLTTHHLVKFMNRKHEWMAQGLENLASMAAIFTNYRYPYERFTRIWKNICLMHMHDVLSGTSIPEVYDDCYDLWTLAENWLNEIRTEVLTSIRNGLGLKEGPSGILICNPLPVHVNQPIEIPLDPKIPIPKSLRDKSGKIYPIQVLPADSTKMEPFERRSERFVVVAKLAPGEVVTSQLLAEEAKEFPKVSITETDANITMQNRFYRVSIDKKTGSIISLKLLDTQNPNSEKNTIETIAGPSNILGCFEDFTGGEPAWNYDPDYWKKPYAKENTTISAPKLIEQGPVRWTIAFDTTVKTEDNGNAVFTQKISLYADSEGIDCETVVDWNMEWSSIKSYYNIAGKPVESIAEVAYGTIRRGLYPTANHDKPRWENNMQTFVTLPAQENQFCFNILNTGKYGYDNIRGNIIGISMIRGPHYPDTNKESWANEERMTREKAGKGTVPEYIDKGLHRIQLRLLPRRGGWESQHIESDAHSWNCPPLTQYISYYPIDRESLITTTAGIEATSMKIREEPHELLENWHQPEGRIKATSWIIRAYETQGKEQQGSIEFSTRMGIKSIQSVDLTELPVEDGIEVEKDTEGNITRITGTWAPHEIKSILIFRTVYYNQHENLKTE